jgi:hydrogenase nickel incorporation protein HypB
VCPAIYDLGQHAYVVALSLTEGEDKPLKYPTIFHKADLVLLTKIDLLPQLDDFDMAAIEQNLKTVMPRPAVLRVSAKTGAGIDQWIRWLAGIGRPRATRCAAAAAAGWSS